MSDYEDAIENSEDSSPTLLNGNSVRQRPTPLLLWNADDLSVSEEVPGFNEVKKFLEEDDESSGLDEEDGVGCPLPSTPVEQTLLDTEFTEVLKAGVLSDEFDIRVLSQNATKTPEEFVRKVLKASWRVVNYKSLPTWLQDNEFLLTGHRPPLASFWACFKSIFRIHTETVNIWTHLLGVIVFIGIATYTSTKPLPDLSFGTKVVFFLFFSGAIICLTFSSLYHIVYCHSENVSRFFSKLDYCGIAVLIMVSFVPWLYFGFYCKERIRWIYMGMVVVFTICSIVVALWDTFSAPSYRPVRAGVFMGFGLAGVVPAVHHVVSEGFFNSVTQASLGWVVLMGFLYILGALVYTLRVPERFFPGKCDIWFQSHQIFHLFVLAGILVHYVGIHEMASYRVMVGDCTRQNATPIVF